MYQVALMNFDGFSACRVLKEMAKICAANASRVSHLRYKSKIRVFRDLQAVTGHQVRDNWDFLVL